MRVCKRDGCDNELTGRKDRKYCCQYCEQREWTQANASRVAVQQRTHYLANTERVKNRSRERYRKFGISRSPSQHRANEARRRARKASAVFQTWVRRTDHDDALCYWCGTDDIAHVDHVMPISLGGPAVPSNEVPSCADCNLRKNAKHPLVWIAELIERA